MCCNWLFLTTHQQYTSSWRNHTKSQCINVKSERKKECNRDKKGGLRGRCFFFRYTLGFSIWSALSEFSHDFLHRKLARNVCKNGISLPCSRKNTVIMNNLLQVHSIFKQVGTMLSFRNLFASHSIKGFSSTLSRFVRLLFSYYFICMTFYTWCCCCFLIFYFLKLVPRAYKRYLSVVFADNKNWPENKVENLVLPAHGIRMHKKAKTTTATWKNVVNCHWWF